MSSKQPKEDRNSHTPIAPRCLVLALKSKGDRRRSNGRSSGGTQFDGDVHGTGNGRSRSVSPAQTPTQTATPTPTQPGGTPPTPTSPDSTKTPSVSSGKCIWEQFQVENSGCYWNPHLEESVRNLKYIGHIHPNTLLVSGRDIYLDTVRNAFARRVLRPPPGFTLHKVGELEPLEMSLIQQTQFTPLPEALCVVIHELNLEEVPATLDSVQERLRDRYKGMQAPPEEIVYETLGSLMKERKIYHTGSAGTGYFIVTPDTYKNGCFNHAHLNHNPQIPTLYIPFLTQASTEMRSISCQTEEKEAEKEEKKKGKLERSQSLKASKGKEKKTDALNRTTSLRYSDDKAKQIFKDINLKTSDAHQDKDKGEKTSLFTKIFGRGKSRKSTTIDESEEVPPSIETEYATFSAQFPPPEWAWYENQAAPTQVLTGSGGMMPRAHTWHHMQGIPHFDAGTQSEYDEEDYMKPCPLPADMNGHHNGVHTNLHVPRQATSSSHDSRSSSFDVSPSPHRSGHENHRHKHRSSSKGRRHSLRHPLTTANQNEYVEYDRDSHIYCEPSNPPHLYARNIQYEGGGAECSTPINPNDPSLSLNSRQKHHQQGKSNNRESGDNNIAQTQSKSQPSPRPKSAKAIRYKELQCPSFCGNDISMEYKGRMPKRNSHFSLSRDSGVNCVGLKEGPTNQQSLKDKKVTVLNNQTGASNSRSNGALSLSNHNLMTAETSFPVQQEQNLSELVSHSHQDSGFSSPRTDALKAYADYHHHHSLPLNVSTNSNKASGAVKTQTKSLPTKVLTSKPPNSGPHTHRDSGRLEKGKENKVRETCKSIDSIQITSSEKYPSYGQLHLVEEKDTTTCSSRSGSSKTTVVERSGDPNVKGGPRGFLSLDTTPSPSKHDSTYMEIQLVTSDCPIHGESPRTSHHKDDVPKRHSHGNKTRDSKHHSGQWSHHRLSSNVHHYGNLDKNVNGKETRGQQQQQQQQQNSSNPRLAFLGDCEVVGIL